MNSKYEDVIKDENIDIGIICAKADRRGNGEKDCMGRIPLIKYI